MAGIAGLADRAQRDGALARTVAWAIPAGAIVAFLALCWTLRHFVTDDAWISVRYAESLAAGHGFVWNPGGPRVEGFSNPLLVSIEALGTMVGLGAIGLARLVGVGSGVALILLLAREGRAAVGVAASRVAVVLVGLSPPLALWAMGGLETLPTALAIAAGVVPLCRDGDRRRAGLVAGIAFATLPWLRPEGLGVVLAVGLAAALPRLARREGRHEAATLAARVCGPAIVSQLILEAVRLTVYGHLLPNSFIYKAGTGGTFDVLRTFAQSAAPVVAAGIVGMLLARGRRRLLAVPPLVYAVGSLGTLDQVDAFGRFLLPTLPEFALLAGVALVAVQRRVGPRALLLPAAGATALALLGLAKAPGGLRSVRHFANSYADCRQTPHSDAAAWLRTHAEPATTFSISDAGLVPARAGGRPAIDQLMLNEPSIQHTGRLYVRGRVRFVHRRQPHVIVLASFDPQRFRGRYGTDAAIYADPRFGVYRLAHVSRPARASCRYSLFSFVRTAG